MSKKERSKRTTAKNRSKKIDGWCLYNELIDEYTFMRNPPDILTTGSNMELRRATLTIHLNH